MRIFFEFTNSTEEIDNKSPATIIYENDIPWNSVNIIDVIPIRNGETLNIDDILSKFPKIEESDTTKDYVVSIASTRQEEITVDLSGIKFADNQ